MNEKLQYAEMLEIPISTCNITYKSTNKKTKRNKKQVNPEEVKQELIDKINQSSIEEEEIPIINQINTSEIQTSAEVRKKSKAKFNVIGAQLIIIGILIATIFLTTALVPNSGIGAFMQNVFSKDVDIESTIDLREYNDFSATIPVSAVNGVTTSEGIMTLSHEGSIYSPCNGKIKSILFDEETKKYTIEIAHSEKFSTMFSGIDYAYSGIGESVFSNIPIGYIKSPATMCFYNGTGDLITGYTLNGNSIVWAV
jgi:hypothetical protein